MSKVKTNAQPKRATKAEKSGKTTIEHVVAEFRCALQRLWFKVQFQHFADGMRRMRAEGLPLPPRDELVQELRTRYPRDPEDEQQRTEARRMLKSIGMSGPDDLAAGVAFARSTWRSVTTPLADATGRLAEAATAAGFTAGDVACAVEFELVLRQALHACPTLDNLKLARPVEVLAAQMLRAPKVDMPAGEPDGGANEVAVLTSNVTCIEIMQKLVQEGRPLMPADMCRGLRAVKAKERTIGGYLARLFAAGLVWHAKKRAPYIPTDPGRIAFGLAAK